MAFSNAKSILGIGSPLSSFKLLLMAASFSRPKFRSLCLGFLQPFVKDGQVPIRYRCYGRYMRSFVRVSELHGDWQSTCELSAKDTYNIDHAFRPDLVIDGGGNIGLFTLRVAAAMSAQGDNGVKFVICEPLQKNVQQIRKHLALNGVQAEIMEVCIGGTRGSIPFYVRDANQSSFDPAKPYKQVMEIPVCLLYDAIESNPAERIFIKLDIEGMEVEALSSFVPSERRPVYIVGELHDFAKDASQMERLFKESGWTIMFDGATDNISSFRACSPAALPLLPSMAAA